MKTKDEKYTQARRAITDPDHPAPGSEDPVGAALRPGRVVGIVSGGGMTNLALVISYLIGFQDRGHWLTYVRSERTGLFEVPSPFDFVCARGLAGYDQLGELIVAHDPQVEELLMALADDTTTHGPLLPSDWRQHLIEKTTAGRTPVVWVQDIQVGAPLALGRSDDYDGIPDQLSRLRDIAAETGAIIAVGHCMPHDWPDGWEMIVDGTDDTFVIASDLIRTGVAAAADIDNSDAGAEVATVNGGAGRGATISHHSHDAPPANFRRTIDTSFSRWRTTVMQGS